MSKLAIISIVLAAVSLLGCESIHEAEERDEVLSAPVNCVTAKGDLRVLESEKAHVANQRAAGASTVSPASAPFGTGPAGGVTFEAASPQPLELNNNQMEVDRYDKAVNQKIAEIKATCGL